jgi:nucleotide-binding universal stress UspA family protein
MDVKTILWPTDLSENSLKALNHVRDLASKHGAQVILLYVGIDLKNYFPAYGNYPNPELYERFEAWEQQQARTRLDELCSSKLGGCPKLVTRIAAGDAAEEILKVIKECKVDLVVMTSHGHGHGNRQAEALHPGHTAERVSRLSPVPVHMVNPYEV